MQLMIILALLLLGGGNVNGMLKEVKPVLESLGGEDIQKALKSAEEISEVLSAISPLTGGSAPAQPKQASLPLAEYPLAPVSAIADSEITYSLNKYIHSN